MPSTSWCAYSFSYIFESQFVPAIDYHFFKLRVIPCQNECQRLVEHELLITPACHWSHSTDGQGNRVQYGGYDELHGHFRVESRGVVECSDYRLPDASPRPYYGYASPLTSCNEQMSSWLQAEPLPADPIGAATAVMHRVNQRLSYVPGVTDNNTRAEQVFELRQGVCQDYAHLMIALCRRLGLHARYVNGLIAGEGATHAWVEVYDGQSWLAFDPTHDCQIHQGYIKLAHGRDVTDCPTNRGRLYSWTSETLQCWATVNKL